MRPFRVLLLSWCIVLVAVSAGAPPNSDTVASISSVMFEGEELIYEVSWAFIKLGRIRLLTLPATPGQDGVAYRSIAYSDSYDLPFVDYHAYSTTDMDTMLFSKGSSLFEKKDDGRWFRQVYSFAPSTRSFITENSYVNDLHLMPVPWAKFDTLQLSYERFQDGTSILYFARAHVHAGRAIAVPTLVRGKAGRTEFYLPGERTKETIEAVPYPIRVVQLEGKADFEGIFGLTGDFIGWFSDDGAAVPIKAKMKVILGSINIQLIEWKRPGWSPPRAE